VTAGAAPAEPAAQEPETIADVCLICEGTYPFIAGGVSSWVHDIIRGEPDVTFLVLNIGSSPAAYGEPRFQFPPNVVGMQRLFCQDTAPTPIDGATRAALDRAIRRFRRAAARRRVPSRRLAAFRRLHMEDGMDDALIADLAAMDLSLPDLLYGDESFALVQEMAERLAPQASFMDLFWQLRSMNVPLVRLLASPVRLARSYHALSAGYAGLLGAVASLRTGMPFVITEHGIYARERDIELARAEWIPDHSTVDPMAALVPSFSPLRRLWSRYFRRLSQVAYHQATHIVTLSEVNRGKQIADGAPRAKTRVIPNGVAVAPEPAAVSLPDGAARRHESEDDPLRVGFVGRLVPIKDLMTLIRACDLALREVPLDVRIIGPEDEDPAYARRCRDLVAALGREDSIRFLGMQPAGKIYGQIDVLLLTSFSEGQPLVILEAFAAGVPVVTTDVGCCREMIEGQPGADRALGPSGFVTRVAVPADTARALVTLVRDRALLRRCGQAARRRLLAHYERGTMLASYRDLYREVLV
jgi:glycosyltransferase involved in cell wall biosynthesis